MKDDVDVVIVGAGGDGPVAAWRLGLAGLDVLVLEAGPWYGNDRWPSPNESGGPSVACSDPEHLDRRLLEDQLTKRELEMGPIFGKFRWGPADRTRAPWPRLPPDGGYVFQVAGVGGTTLHYLGNHPRAFPSAIDEQGHWPIDYDDLVPYYKRNEELLPVAEAPATTKEEIFYQGADTEWDLLDVKNVTEPGYRPQPNAILQPADELRNPHYEGPFTYPKIEGSTLAGHDMQGPPHPIGAPVDEKAKRTTLVSYVPLALRTGNVTIRPNAFVTDVVTDTPLGDDPVATGVTYRDTWTGDTHDVSAEVVVLAAGAIETPRLWLNSGLPESEWVGRGMTIHWPDIVFGVWDEATLRDRVGKPTIDPHVGPDSGARFDYPGIGSLQVAGLGPGITSIVGYAASSNGYAFDSEVPADAPWDTQGRVVGEDLKRKMADYKRTLPLLILTDDRPRKHNRVETAPGVEDEHGPVPQVSYDAHPDDDHRRDRLVEIGSRILRDGGATHVHRVLAPPSPLHIHSTMRIGEVTDAACEARDVERLFIADHSVLGNSVGGPNPTNTGQALAMRTADKILHRYW